MVSSSNEPKELFLYRKQTDPVLLQVGLYSFNIFVIELGSSKACPVKMNSEYAFSV